MQTYVVNLVSSASDSFRCQKAANSLDIDVEKKLIHNLKVSADVESDFSIGLIIGASGSGKTTLAKQIYGQQCFNTVLDESKPIIDQFPQDWSYDQCAEALNGIGLTQVVCWIRPVATLSNGQKARAEAALALAYGEIKIIDEWTSVVDRTVAKVMSHCVQKHARKNKKRVVLVSCHYDVIEWLQPDWIIDCNTQTYENRRSLQQVRNEKLEFTVKECSRESWKYFSKYHYLSERLPGGKLYLYGLYHGDNQIGFQCFANYVPTRKGDVAIYHSNRTVIHPDYAGFGLGIKIINETAELMLSKGYRVMAKFSSTPIYKSMSKQKNWKLKEIRRDVDDSVVGSGVKKNVLKIKGGFRTKVKTYSFEYLK